MMYWAPQATLNEEGRVGGAVRNVAHDSCCTHGAFFVGIDASVFKKQLHNGNAAIKSSPIESIKALTSRMGG